MTLQQSYYVYILSNPRRTVYYTGITNHLLRRTYEHRSKLIEGFTKRYNVTDLLYYEQCNDPLVAITREKQIKDYRREKKLTLIRSLNPKMIDLYPSLL